MDENHSRDGPLSLSPSDAAERFLNKKATSVRDSMLQTYYNRLNLFDWWCKRRDIDRIDDVSGWIRDEYENHHSSITVPITL